MICDDRLMYNTFHISFKMNNLIKDDIGLYRTLQDNADYFDSPLITLIETKLKQ